MRAPEVHYIGFERQRLSPKLANLPGGTVHLRNQEVDQCDIVLGAGKSKGTRSANTARTARDNRNLAYLLVRHS